MPGLGRAAEPLPPSGPAESRARSRTVGGERCEECEGAGQGEPEICTGGAEQPEPSAKGPGAKRGRRRRSQKGRTPTASATMRIPAVAAGGETAKIEGRLAVRPPTVPGRGRQPPSISGHIRLVATSWGPSPPRAAGGQQPDEDEDDREAHPRGGVRLRILSLVGHLGQNRDAVLDLFEGPAILLPGVEASDGAGRESLGGNQQHGAKPVAGEAGRDVQPVAEVL